MNNTVLTLAIIQAILQYGPQAVITIGDAMRDTEITPEDVDKLFIDKEPEEYFK
jgi:pyrrolidone-carboxylate peptidase